MRIWEIATWEIVTREVALGKIPLESTLNLKQGILLIIYFE